jgi:hypothetical protein
MIHLTFMVQNRDIIRLDVDGKVVRYTDKLWKDGVQFMPKDPQFVLKLLQARNRIPFSNQIIQWINESNSGKNLEEYLKCETEEDIAEIIRMDARKKGLIEVTK